LVSLRLVSLGLVPQAKISPAKKSGRALGQTEIGRRQVYFGKEHGTLECKIYNRDLLEPEHKIAGPAIVEQLDTTTVIHPEQAASVDEYGNLMIRERE
jgi:N-methylhydantoinase A